MAEFSDIINVGILGREIDWVEIDNGEVKTYIQQNYNPEDMFSWSELEEWAENNGFHKR